MSPLVLSLSQLFVYPPQLALVLVLLGALCAIGLWSACRPLKALNTCVECLLRALLFLSVSFVVPRRATNAFPIGNLAAIKWVKAQLAILFRAGSDLGCFGVPVSLVAIYCLFGPLITLGQIG